MTDELLVIGGGAAGLMAALAAAQIGVPVRVLEKNEKVGRKLYITGKGRCNVTNHCTTEEALASIVRNGRFLYSAFTYTPPEWVENFFEQLGVPLKVERGNRVFPCSDRAADIIDALFHTARRAGVKFVHDNVQTIETTDGRITKVIGRHATYDCGAAILATGGCSYPATGSTGDGFAFAQRLGHNLVAPMASLVPIETEGDIAQRMQGLSLKNVQLTIKDHRKKLVFQQQGELLFTHFGISGPLVISASAYMRNWEMGGYTCSIDLKPALDEATLDSRLVRELKEGSNRNIGTILQTMLPRLMIEPFAQQAGVPLDRKGHDVTKGERRRVLDTMRQFPLVLKGLRPIEEAIVTAGGVKVGEIDPKTMRSKRVENLYFAGELIDVDALTGGYNLQIAWATGRVAGESAAQTLLESTNGVQ